MNDETTTAAKEPEATATTPEPQSTPTTPAAEEPKPEVSTNKGGFH